MINLAARRLSFGLPLIFAAVFGHVPAPGRPGAGNRRRFISCWLLTRPTNRSARVASLISRRSSGISTKRRTYRRIARSASHS